VRLQDLLSEFATDRVVECINASVRFRMYPYVSVCFRMFPYVSVCFSVFLYVRTKREREKNGGLEHLALLSSCLDESQENVSAIVRYNA
jgi:hypothetical protein